ncbi:hypothetical protein [Nocardia sp. BMG51109]|uniref:hypothetical protein n=1 Tax=Nocardia sp. BMG51109 TaxID=1056816 RepID=UPI0012EBB802|nr:hypothetical protein [Nocardia sp. BMG51109]
MRGEPNAGHPNDGRQPLFLFLNIAATHTPTHGYLPGAETDSWTLASACLYAGDYDGAARYGRETVDILSTVSSQRCRTRLQDLDSLASRYDRNPVVAEMREEVRPVISTAC